MKPFLRIGSLVYRQASKLVMYHGTATGEGDEQLRKILKEGLNPDAPKVFEGGEDWQEREIETLGGIYLAPTVQKAQGYASGAARKFGGDPMLVIVRVESKSPSVSLDEDELFGKVFSPRNLGLAPYIQEKYNLELNEASILDSLLEEDWNEVARHFLGWKGRTLSQLNIPPQREQAILPLLTELLQAQARYFLAKRYLDLKEKRSFYYKFLSGYEEYGVEDPNKLLTVYRKLMDRFLEKLREATTPTAEGLQQWGKGSSLRTKELLNYRGANRILAILRWEDVKRESEWIEIEDEHRRRYDQPYHTLGEVVYSSSGVSSYIADAIADMSKSIGENMLWKDKSGKVLYDEPSSLIQKAAMVRQAAAKSVGDLDKVDGHISVDDDGDEITFTLNIDDKVVGEVTLQWTGECEAWEVVTSAAPRGWGPLLYDVALEYAGDVGVIPDRSGVSSDALRVWKYYSTHREDIHRLDLTKEECWLYEEGDDVLDFRYIKDEDKTIYSLQELGLWETSHQVVGDYEDVGFTEHGRWGNAGSGLLFTTGERILLLERSDSVEEPGTWGIPGGAIPEGESGLRDALKSAEAEAAEELGSFPKYNLLNEYVYEEPDFTFTTFVGAVREEFTPTLDWENDDYAWVSRSELSDYDLHFGVVELLKNVEPFF